MRQYSSLHMFLNPKTQGRKSVIKRAKSGAVGTQHTENNLVKRVRREYRAQVAERYGDLSSNFVTALCSVKVRCLVAPGTTSSKL
jgi:hypothetical protein